MAERKKVQKVHLGGNKKNTAKHSPKRNAVKKTKIESNNSLAKSRVKNNNSHTEKNYKSNEKVVKISDIMEKNKSRSSNIKNKTDVIPMEKSESFRKRHNVYASRSGNKKIGPGLSIILGKKQENRRKRLTIYMIVFPFVFAIILFTLLTPTGPIEAITNGFSVIGKGEYPKAVSGSKVISIKSKDNLAFLLTDTHISAYTASGKTMFEYQHDFSNPVMKISDTRCLVYNRESTGFIISNNGNLLYKKDLEKSVYCADIADNGNVAFVTASERYSAQVEVFSKGMKSKFIWYLVDGLVSDVTISNNGKKIAVAVLKVKNGAYFSEIYCFDIGKELPIFTLSVSDTPVLKLETVSSACFAYTTEKSVSFVKWKNGLEVKSEESGMAPSFFKTKDGQTVAVFGKNTSSTVNIYSSDGIKKHSFIYNTFIDDISVSNDKIYILKSNKISVLDFEGNLLKAENSDQSLCGISASNKGIFAADNLNITYYK